MEKITILAPAKINLYLNVGARREDGYHDIETVMQTVTLFDRVEVTKNDWTGQSAIDVWCRDPAVPNGEDNIVYRAALAFLAEAGIEEYDLSFLIEKKIPVEAGLGGGSSDAAATILALDRLYHTEMTTDSLCAIGARVGADVPFCIKKGTASARGIGEILTSCTPMPDCAFLVAIPIGSRVCTAEAYGKIDAVNAEAPFSIDSMMAALSGCDTEQIALAMFNKFELVTTEETGAAALACKMLSLGALGARMSGSGPAVFGVFRDVPSARAAKESMGDDVSSFVCVPARRDHPYIES